MRAPMPYFKDYKVPVWVIIERSPKLKKILKWFKDNEAHEQLWPATGFKNVYDSYATKGWGHVVNKPGPKNPDLLLRCFTDHIKNLNSYVQVFPDYHRLSNINRDLNTEQDFEKFFNQCFDLLSDRDLSRLFWVQEICFPTINTGCKVFVSSDKFDYTTVKRLAQKVVIIGEAKTEGLVQPDILIEDLINADPKEIGDILGDKMSEIMSTVSIKKY